MAEPILKEYAGLRFYNWWRFSLKIAPRVVRVKPKFLDSIKVRLTALATIKSPVFILGCPRSGTTYLGEVLEEIPSASYFFEPPIMKYYARLVFQGRRTPKQLRRFYDFCFRTLLFCAPGTGPRVIEKNPNHTLVAKQLLEAYPDAKFIVISRDGRDIALSLSKKPWHLASSVKLNRREPGGYLYGPYAHFYIEPSLKEEFEATSDINRCFWIWRKHAEKMIEMSTSLPESCQYHISYEDLINNSESVLKGILEFIGENTAEATRAVLAASARGHAGSIGAWKTGFSDSELQNIREADKLFLRDQGFWEGM